MGLRFWVSFFGVRGWWFGVWGFGIWSFGFGVGTVRGVGGCASTVSGVEAAVRSGFVGKGCLGSSETPARLNEVFHYERGSAVERECVCAMKEVNDVHSSVRAHMATGLTDLPGQWLQCQASGAQTVSGVEAAVRRSDEGLDQRAHQHLLTCKRKSLNVIQIKVNTPFRGYLT